MIDSNTDQFGKFYLLLNIAVFVAIHLSRELFRRLSGPQLLVLPSVEPSESAYLAAGYHRAVHCALAGLAQRGLIKVNEDLIVLDHKKTILNPTELETAVANSVGDAGRKPTKLYRLLERERRSLHLELQRGGLAPSDRECLWINISFLVLSCIPFLIGLTRLIHRLPQHRPVVLLGFLCSIPPLLALMITSIPITTNRNGITLLSMQREKHRFLSHIGYRKGLTLPPQTTALAVALFGLKAIRETNLARLADLLDPVSQGGDGDSSDSSGSDSGGDSGGSGGGDAF